MRTWNFTHNYLQHSVYSRSPGLQLFRERLSEKVLLVHVTILKGIVGGFEFSFFQRNLKELARKAMEMCLRVLKESNKSRFDSYSRQEQCSDHIPYYLSGLSRAHFSDNLSWNSCIHVKLSTAQRCFLPSNNENGGFVRGTSYRPESQVFGHKRMRSIPQNINKQRLITIFCR